MKRKIHMIPLVIALITGGIILLYWLGVLRYSLKSHDLSLDELSKINSDFVGTLYIKNVLNTEIVQGSDNSFYLTHAFDRTENAYGCPFVDYKWTEEDSNMVIYGHNNLNGTAFSKLVKYGKDGFPEKHSQIVLTTKDGTVHLYQVFLVLEYDVNFQRFNNPYLLSLPEDYVRQMDRFIVYQNMDIYYQPGDKLITLSTCDESVYGADGRLIVVGKEVVK